MLLDGPPPRTIPAAAELFYDNFSRISRASGNRPVWSFENINSPSFLTSKAPPDDLMSLGFTPVAFSISAAKLTAFGV